MNGLNKYRIFKLSLLIFLACSHNYVICFVGAETKPFMVSHCQQSVNQQINLTITAMKKSALVETALAGLQSMSTALGIVNPLGKRIKELGDFLRKSLPTQSKLIMHFQPDISVARPSEIAEWMLEQADIHDYPATLTKNLNKLQFTIRGITPSEFLQSIIDTYHSLPAIEAVEGYSPEVMQIDPDAPHSIASPVYYAALRIGSYVFDYILREKVAVEFHEGPAGQALKSLRERAYGRFYRFVAPGVSDMQDDGGYLTFRLTDGNPLVFFAGSLGRERFLHNQARFRTANIPSDQVRRFEHRYSLEPMIRLLNTPAETGDTVLIGFSTGPVRGMIAREEARRCHEQLREAGFKAPNSLPKALAGVAPEILSVVQAPNHLVLQDYDTSRRVLALKEKLLLLAPDSRAAKAAAVPGFKVWEESIGADIFKIHRFTFLDPAGQRHRLLTMGIFWGGLARIVTSRLASLGYRRFLFQGIAGSLRSEDKIGNVHRIISAFDENGQNVDPQNKMIRWLGTSPDRKTFPARGICTYSPLSETLSQIETWRKAGFTTVDMEVAHLISGLMSDVGDDHPEFEALLVISDIPGDFSGQTIESRHFHKNNLALGGELILDLLFTGLDARSIDIENKLPEKIGFFTGTFDPIHEGHIESIRRTAEIFGLNRVLFVPNAISKHKPFASPYRARCELLQHTIGSRPRMEMWGGPDIRMMGLTHGTGGIIDNLVNSFPQGTVFMQLMGSDSFLALAEKDKVLHSALEQAQIIVMLREGMEEEENHIREIAKTKGHGRIHITDPCLDRPFSSTAIREALVEGKPIADVSAEAAKEIMKKRLYRKKIRHPFESYFLQKSETWSAIRSDGKK